MDVILDSGAYSAWTRGVVIDREKYADYILQHMKYYKYFVNLDCIPSVPGDKHITQDKVELSASEGWDNLEYLLSRGIPKDRLLPVFHQGENFYWLEKMRDAKFPYIGISPGNDRCSNERITWLDECMYYVCDSSGLPYMKWHGFGVTGFRVMKAVPWYSVDSISYSLVAGFGGVYFPQPGRNGNKYSFSGAPFVVNVSSNKHSMKPNSDTSTNIYFNDLSEQQKKFFQDYLVELDIPWGESTFREESLSYKSKPGSNERVIRSKHRDHVLVETRIQPGLINDMKYRSLVNIIYLYRYACLRPPWPWRYTYPRNNFGLLRKSTVRAEKSLVSANPEPLRIYCASTFHVLNWLRKSVIDSTGVDWYRCLVSYYYIGNCNAVCNQLEAWDEAKC